MKRKLSVAISLIGDPKIVFMDEPTSGLSLSFIEFNLKIEPLHDSYSFALKTRDGSL